VWHFASAFWSAPDLSFPKAVSPEIPQVGGLHHRMKKALELVDEYLGYLVTKLSALTLVTSPYYSKHVACTLQQLSVGEQASTAEDAEGRRGWLIVFSSESLRALCGLPFSLFKRNML